MIKIFLVGSSGQMGRVIAQQVDEMDGFEIVGGRSRENNSDSKFPVFKDMDDFKGQADAIIDFSSPAMLPEVLKYSLDKKIPLVAATTGYSQGEEGELEEASRKIPILYSRNMSLGINLLLSLVKKASSALEGFDIEIIEKHHNKKVDSPSGTALMIAEAIDGGADNPSDLVYGRKGINTRRGPKEIGIHAVRGGTIVGEHSVLFAGTDEVLEIKHSAMSKKIFALGAINAAKFLVDKEAGLYSMDDLFENI